MNDKTETMWHFTNINAIEIPRDADMDDEKYRVPGVYLCHDNSSSATLSNCPANGEAFTLFVYKPLGSHVPYTTQEFRTLYNKLYKRFWNFYDNTWDSELKYITNTDLMPQQVLSITSIADPQNISFNTLKYARIGNLIVGWIGGFRLLNKGTFIINNGDLPEPLTQVHVAVMSSETDIYIGNMYLDVNSKKLSIRGINPNPTGDRGYASFSYVAK